MPTAEDLRTVEVTTLTEEIRALVVERDAVLLAHNYQRAEVQDAADFVGDSLGLSREAAATDARLIVFAGVHFMAETAKILAPAKTVLLPEPAAGCPMANMITAEQARAFKDAHPGLPLVTYVNSSAEVKAETAVVRSLGTNRVLFAPDRNLGAWVASQLPDVEVTPWDGFCPIHDAVTPEMVREAQERHPDAEVITHPECRPEVNALADAVLSTSGMLRHVASSPAEAFIIVTEGGLLHGLAKAAPGKRFVSVTPQMLCPNMKLTTLVKVRDCLREMSGVVTVPADVRVRALAAVERMVAIA